MFIVDRGEIVFVDDWKERVDVVKGRIDQIVSYAQNGLDRLFQQRLEAVINFQMLYIRIQSFMTSPAKSSVRECKAHVLIADFAGQRAYCRQIRVWWQIGLDFGIPRYDLRFLNEFPTRKPRKPVFQIVACAENIVARVDK